MEYILSIISEAVGDATAGGWLLVTLTAGAVFALAVSFLLVMSAFFDPVRSRMSRVVGGPSATQTAVTRIAEYLQTVPLVKDRHGITVSSTTRRLVLAGYRSAGSVHVYYGIRFFVFVAFPVVTVFLLTLVPGMDFRLVLLFGIMATAIAYIVPSFVLDHLIAKRQMEIRNSFPDILDMLVVCTEAGLGLDAAIQRVSKELNVSHSVLADELALVNAEIRAGANRADAYRNLALRTGLPEIRGLVATLTQSMQFGTNVADVLRIYSEDFRDKRLQAAEEKAAKLAVKLIFPLVFCFMPAFFIITMGPAVLGLSKVLRGIAG